MMVFFFNMIFFSVRFTRTVADLLWIDRFRMEYARNNTFNL